MSFTLRHLVGALMLHGALFALLAGGVQCSRPVQRPPVIQAILLDPSRTESKAQQRRQEQERKRVAEQRRKEQEQRREEERQQEAERKERARVEAETEARQKAEAEAKRKAETEAKQKAADERKQQEAAQKKKTEEEARKKQIEQERREKEQQAKREAESRESLEQAMQQEQFQRQVQREQEARRKSEQDIAFNNWIALVSDKVARNWTRPPAAQDQDFECKVLVQQLPGGQVASARITESCGNQALDESVVKAVLRSDPLPTVSDQSLFQREFTFVFVPRT